MVCNPEVVLIIHPRTDSTTILANHTVTFSSSNQLNYTVYVDKRCHCACTVIANNTKTVNFSKLNLLLIIFIAYMHDRFL